MTVPLPNVAEALNKGGPPSVVWRAWFQAINAKFQAGDLSLSEVQTALDAIRAQLEEMGAGNVSQGEGIAVYGTLADTLTIALRALEDSGTGGALLKITRDQYGRVEGTEAATTDDLTEGATNLYYTDARADARVTAGIQAFKDDPALTVANLANAADDAAAATAGVAVGELYRDGSTLKIRVT